MSAPGPFVAETDLQAPRRRPHVNLGPDIQDPPRRDAGLVHAADRLLEAAQRFVDGALDYGALRCRVVRYRAAVVRAGLAPGSVSDTGESDGQGED